MSAVPLMKLHTPVQGSNDARDSDQMSEEEDDPLESVLARMKYRPHYYRTQDFWSSIIFTGALCLIVGFVMSYITFISMGRNKKLLLSVGHDVNLDVASAILNKIVPAHIDTYLRDLKSTTLANASQYQSRMLSNHFTELGFDLVSSMSSVVLMSYFDKTKPNKVSIMNPLTEVESYNNSESSYFETPIGVQVSNTIKGEVAYINFGQDSDFQYLKKLNINLMGCIVLARLGKVSPVHLVDGALKRGAKGVVLFADPQQYPNTASRTEPFLWPSQLGILQYLHGDPSTPETRDMVNEDHTQQVDCVPLQIISARSAESILLQMTSNIKSPESWMGNLTTIYPMGPGFSLPSYQLQMEINVVNVEKEFVNVVAAIKGDEEPDRYVLLGSDRESLVGNSSSRTLESTANMMELARVLSDLRISKGWSPRRTVVLCSWGVTQSQGYFRTAPFNDNWTNLFYSRAVAYLNIDMTKPDSRNFSCHGAPLLSQLLHDATALIPSPNIGVGKSTVYDEWLEAAANTTNPLRPVVSVIGPEEDLLNVLQDHGIPSLHFQFGDQEAASSTQINIRYHKAAVQLWGILTWMLADSFLLPFSVHNYATFLMQSVAALKAKYESVVIQHSLPLDHLALAVKDFSDMAETFQKKLSHLEKTKSLEMRIMNDQLIHLEKIFLHHSTFEKGTKHIALAPGAAVSNDISIGFGTLQDLLSDISTSPIAIDLRPTVRDHINELAHCIRSASSLLQDPVQPLVFDDL